MKPTPKIYLTLLLFLFTGIISGQAAEPPFLKYKNDVWVNQQLEQLSIENKIAQLMMITAYPKQNNASKEALRKIISTYNPGGVLVMQGTPTKTTSWINQFQAASETPLLIAIDGEWGPAMRIDSTVIYPYAQTLGAIQDTNLVYQMGRDYGEQLKMLGIHMNFAPVADINTNPSNPVINFRSFGEDKHNVAVKSWMVAKGMQDVGVIPVAKHFPGHGDTKTDSHKTLPLVPHSKQRLDEIESYPFRYLSDKGISGIMSAHLNVPALDNSGKASSLSKNIITDYLKTEIGFKGFIVTDAITMKGVQAESGRAEFEAIRAGNDMVEFVPDMEKAINAVKTAIAKGTITEDEITEKCRTILALKRWVGLHQYKVTETTNLQKELNAPKFEVNNRKLIKASFTVLANNDNSLPIQNLDTLKIASINIGSSYISPFQKMLSKYTTVDHFVLSKNAPESEWVALRSKLANYNQVIVGITGIHRYPSKKYGTTEVQRKAISELVRENNSTMVFFGNAYALKYFNNIHHAKGLVLAHQDSKLTQELAAQQVFGATTANGKLPVTVDTRFKTNDGFMVKKNDCFAYTIPEEVGIDSKKLHARIDSIAELGVNKGAYPGCQVLVARNGKIVFHKCYGHHTYSKVQKVTPENIYDWASLTKVTGPLPAIMKLVDEDKINLDASFSTYWPDFKGSDKEHIKFREILAHQARLASWIPFWSTTLTEEGLLDKAVFSNRPSEKYSVRVSEKMYMNKDFRKTMMDTIRNSELETRKHYLYSGLSFYLYPDMIENMTGTTYQNYLKTNFYEPLGAYTITHNAYLHYPIKRIIPTENDDFFRMEKLRGFVHDEGASMMGGISGNAGLFGTANDLAKIFQMYLQKGYFGGKRYISEETVNEFIRIQYPDNQNRRGLGFDKPLIKNNNNSLKDAYPAHSASKSSFGHSGYTGTFAWADPDSKVLYIFMSNRVHPTRDNSKLYKYNIRTAMHQAIYDSIIENDDQP